MQRPIQKRHQQSPEIKKAFEKETSKKRHRSQHQTKTHQQKKHNQQKGLGNKQPSGSNRTKRKLPYRENLEKRGSEENSKPTTNQNNVDQEKRTNGGEQRSPGIPNQQSCKANKKTTSNEEKKQTKTETQQGGRQKRNQKTRGVNRQRPVRFIS